MTPTASPVLLGPLLVLLAAVPSLAQDNQLWSDLVVTTALGPRWGGVFDGQLRFGAPGTFSYQSGEAGVQLKLAPRTLLSSTYRYIHEEPSPGQNSYESQARLVAAQTFSGGGFHITVQNLFEYLFPNGASSYWVDRPVISVVRRVGPERWALTPYVSDQVFYNSSVDAWDRNRLFVGVGKGLGRGLTLQVYYCRESNRSSPDLNIVGVALRLWFRAYPAPEQPDHPVG